jgi:hypothetical protein
MRVFIAIRNKSAYCFRVLAPPPHPAADPFECEHAMRKMDQVTDGSGRKFMLAKCRCRMEFIYRVDDAGKMMKIHAQLGETWIH